MWSASIFTQYAKWQTVKGNFSDLSAQSNLLQVGLVAGASCPPTAYRKPLQVATPTPPRLFDMEVHGIHLLVWGSKHSTDFKQELPSLPPTAYNLYEKNQYITFNLFDEVLQPSQHC